MTSQNHIDDNDVTKWRPFPTTPLPDVDDVTESRRTFLGLWSSKRDVTSKTDEVTNGTRFRQARLYVGVR